MAQEIDIGGVRRVGESKARPSQRSYEPTLTIGMGRRSRKFWSPSALLIVGIAVTAIQQVIGSIIEPEFVGHRLNLSPLAVVMSLVFGAACGAFSEPFSASHLRQS